MSYASKDEFLRELYYFKAFGYKFIDFSSTNLTAQKSLNELEKSIKECNLCELCKGEKSASAGSGDKNARVMFVLNSPATSSAYLSGAGKFSNDIKTATGFEAEKFYTTTLLKCKPSQTPPKSAYELCKPYFSAQVQLLAPRLIVAFGEEVFCHLTNQNSQNFEMVRGNVMRFKNSFLLATYSPELVAKNPSKEGAFLDDLRKIKGFI